MRDRSTKHCENCRSAILAYGLSRPILICCNRKWCEGKLFVVERKGTCCNYQRKKIYSRRKRAPLPDSNDVRYIPLTQGKFTIVDADDYDRLAKYKWSCERSGYTFYASRANGDTRVSMHREIMNAPKGLLVDHIDGNGLNNRRSNLRLCTYAQNAHNSRPMRNASSRYKGVCWHKRNKKWYVSIYKSGKRYHLGCFDNEAEAALAYDRKAKELFGQFAYLNFPELATKAQNISHRLNRFHGIK